MGIHLVVRQHPLSHAVMVVEPNTATTILEANARLIIPLVSNVGIKQIWQGAENVSERRT